MANEVNKTTEILEFKVDQGQGISDLEKMRKTLIGLKEEQKALNDAYKKGNITQEEYVKEITRVDAVLKKVGNSHNVLQKNLAGVQTETSKLIKSNQALAKTFKDSANDISVAGVGLGTLTSRISALANPLGATVAIVGALGAAYARSTVGARDLSFATSQLSSATTILTNDLARLISGSDDGQGFFSTALNTLLTLYGPEGLAAKSQAAAFALEKLEDLQREELEIRSEISDRLSDNQESLTAINEESTKFEDKLISISNIIGNLRTNEQELLAVKEQQLATIENQLQADDTNEELATAKLKLEKEISKIKADSEKKVQAILRLEDNIKQQNEAQAKAATEKSKQIAFQNSELERQARIATLERELRDNRSPIERLRDESQQQVQIVTGASKSMGDASEALAKRVEASNKKQAESNKGVAQSTDAQRDALRLFSSEAARLYQTINKDNRFFAAAQLGIDAGLTLSGITKVTAGMPPRQAAIYRAAAILSATSSLAQAAKLIGAGSPGIADLGPTITASSGEQFVVQDGKAVPLAEAQAKAARGQQRAETLSTVGSFAAAGAAVAGIPGAIGGALIGGLVVLGRRLFGRRRSGFASGGWTGPGETMQPAGIVHADEYVVPKRINNTPEAKPHIRALESMRTRGYAKGGFVSGAGAWNSMGDVFRGARFEVAVTEINRQQNRLSKKVSVANGRIRSLSTVGSFSTLTKMNR